MSSNIPFPPTALSFFLAIILHLSIVAPLPPQWPQFNYDCQNTNGPYEYLPNNRTYPLGPGTNSNTSIQSILSTTASVFMSGILDAQGVLYIGSMDGNLHAIDIPNGGTLKYTIPLLGSDGMIRNNDTLYGPESTSIGWTDDCGYGIPCIFYSAFNKSAQQSTLICSEAKNGNPVWYWDPLTDANCAGGGFSSPTIVGSNGLLYLSCYSTVNNEGEGQQPVIMQMPQESGDLNWYFYLDGLSVGNPAACYLDDNNNDYYVLVMSNVGTLSSYDPIQEKKVWSTPVSQFKYFDKSAAGPSAPVCVSGLPSNTLTENIVYTVVTCANYELCPEQGTATLVALDVNTGKVLFNVSSGGYNYSGSSPIVSSCGLVFSSDGNISSPVGGNLHAPVVYIVGSVDSTTNKLKIVGVNASTGTILLDFILHGVQANESMRKTNAVLTCDVDTTRNITRTYLYFATDKGNIYGIDIENQTVAWTITVRTDDTLPFFSSPILGRQVSTTKHSILQERKDDNEFQRKDSSLSSYPGFLIIGSPDPEGKILNIGSSYP